MKYEIKGGELPVVICYLEDGETMITERGSMSWMSPNMKMETTSNGGIGRRLAGCSPARHSSRTLYGHGRKRHDRVRLQLPGQIRPWEVGPGNEVIVQKSGFLAAEECVDLSVFFQKKLGAGFFGGEGSSCRSFPGAGRHSWNLTGTWWNTTFSRGSRSWLTRDTWLRWTLHARWMSGQSRDSKTWCSEARASLIQSLPGRGAYGFRQCLCQASQQRSSNSCRPANKAMAADIHTLR